MKGFNQATLIMGVASGTSCQLLVHPIDTQATVAKGALPGSTGASGGGNVSSDTDAFAGYGAAKLSIAALTKSVMTTNAVAKAAWLTNHDYVGAGQMTTNVCGYMHSGNSTDIDQYTFSVSTTNAVVKGTLTGGSGGNYIGTCTGD